MGVLDVTNIPNYIDVAKDFSDDPFGRYPDDGDYNATRFRQEFLVPKLRNLAQNQILTVDFTGVSFGLGSSFIEEAFGQLVREGFDKDFLFAKIVYKFPIKFYEIQAKKFISLEYEKMLKEK
ncbi:STAS-like domain-containing protein [Enterobacter asburiae]|uniref:STAS-like domain-containing protein n=1 Tax=Enterobacter asburiae TaxID=61645 RepID=UPI001BDFEB9C|nr:STAS-like domain-containing protein [Enterobacter asburiae]MBT1944257.1 DUF4325 domain-containing protein [Enterobacter hormaechei subsp. xiangfangensis]MDO2453404.1 STAS-like domain-containing protein [Enterobacter asburiae]HAV1850524.1 STAS-like domain-containing protein [Enterobacter hormaechei subsp. xiangfangensis]HCM9643502.1 STAS-like domain-containing protein [Enterobacter hormaechei subsp. xiangfangensis]